MKRMTHILFASGVLLLLHTGVAHANQGPYIGIALLSMLLAIPALICLVILIFIPAARAVAGILLLAMATLLGSCAVFSMTVGTTRHETWQWHGAKANMEVITGVLSSYADSRKGLEPKYPVGDLTWEQLRELLPEANLPSSPDDVHLYNFHYGSEDGKTYRIEADVHTRRPTWIWATPEGIRPDEPESRP
jgi:hypothetical protein